MTWLLVLTLEQYLLYYCIPFFKMKNKKERCRHDHVIELSVDHYQCVDCGKETNSIVEFNGDLND